MDVVSQALHVAARAADSAVDSVVSFEFDLELPAHRAAYAAAMAVLASFGEGPNGIAMPVPTRPVATVDAVAILDPGHELTPLDEALRRAYVAAIDELSGDPVRTVRLVADTFPHVRDVLRDGANVEGVAHVQYMRWSEAQRAVRSSLD